MNDLHLTVVMMMLLLHMPDIAVVMSAVHDVSWIQSSQGVALFDFRLVVVVAYECDCVR